MTLQCGDESDDDGDKDLHAEESKDEDEEEEEEEKGEDGGDGVHQRHHQVPQRGPVPVQEVPLTVLSVIHQTVSQREENKQKSLLCNFEHSEQPESPESRESKGASTLAHMNPHNLETIKLN